MSFMKSIFEGFFQDKETSEKKKPVENSGKKKAAFYWAASCGGCEISVLEVGEKILDVLDNVDVVFWPCIADFKYDDVRKMADNEIDVCFFNGAIRNEENLEIAQLLRKKSKVMIAYGACAHTGGIPSLANFTTREELMKTVYEDAPSNTDKGVYPETSVETDEGTLTIPGMFKRVYRLQDAVTVDYSVPGCPAVPERTMDVFSAFLGGNLPAPGAVVGVAVKSVCDECKKTRSEKKIKKFYRPQEIIPDAEKCLLDQGLVCMGPATRGGCGAQCTTANQGCRGCYGAPEGVEDQGLKMTAMIASLIDSENPAEIREILDTIADPAGTFYRFTTAASLLNGGSKDDN